MFRTAKAKQWSLKANFRLPSLIIYWRMLHRKRFKSITENSFIVDGCSPLFAMYSCCGIFWGELLSEFQAIAGWELYLQKVHVESSENEKKFNDDKKFFKIDFIEVSSIVNLLWWNHSEENLLKWFSQHDKRCVTCSVFTFSCDLQIM